MELDQPTYPKIGRHMWMAPNYFNQNMTKNWIPILLEVFKPVVAKCVSSTLHAFNWISKA